MSAAIELAPLETSLQLASRPEDNPAAIYLAPDKVTSRYPGAPRRRP